LKENDSAMRNVLTHAKVIAVVGHSDTHERTSYQIAQFLRSVGYTVYPVNPTVKEIDGQPSYSSLQEIPGSVDIVNIFRRSEYLGEIEVDQPIPFDQDHVHAAYDPQYAQRFWRILVQADRVMKVFRSRFIGKCSPVHFFWGSFDLAVTRFSGRRAPEHPGGVPNMADWVTKEAYSHEVSSCGFWPGGGAAEPVFYSYAYPEPEGFKDYPIQPKEAFYSSDMREFILPYEAVRRADDPDAVLLAFLQSTYDAAANSGKWERAGLESTS
ncbi:DUF5996 family protein, partial [Pelatocladus sp. BLCC-F211]|uniref:DUF5996 family protein n=1 Tax=Pelatocladus sp. BLCC-F211 TaxID=3342752 RepID=UPI0035B6F483